MLFLNYTVHVIVFLEFGPLNSDDVFFFFDVGSLFFSILAFAAASRSALRCSLVKSSILGSIIGW